MINNHTDLKKPFWVVINTDDTLHYGEIKEFTQLSTKMDIYTFSEKEDMINFIEENNGTFIEFEI